jgi:hypothetical protein
MKRLAIISLSALGLIYCTPASAFTTRTVFSKQAQGLEGRIVDLKVWPGFDLTVNFLQTGEVVKDVLLSDPSRFAFGSLAGSLCPQAPVTEEENCTNTGAKVIYIRRIKPIDFPNLLHSPDGSTLIKVITEGPSGQKEYQFKLSPQVQGTPNYTSLIIRPDSERPKPVSVERQVSDAQPILGSQPARDVDHREQLLSQTNKPVEPIKTNPIQIDAAIATDKLYTQPPVDPSSSTTSNQPISPNKEAKQPEVASALEPATKDLNKKPQSKISQHNNLEANTASSSSTSQIQLSEDYQTGALAWAPIRVRDEDSSNQAQLKRQLLQSVLFQRAGVRTSHTLPSTSSGAVSSKAASYSMESISDANAVVRGLMVAAQREQIVYGDRTWLKTQLAIHYLRQSKSRTEAANLAGIPSNLLTQLIVLGQIQPLANAQEITANIRQRNTFSAQNN